jgi:Family of unknown function (DUF6600)
MSFRTFLIAVLFLLTSLAALSAVAADSPSPRVGRVAAADGAIALRQAGGAWIDSGINDPVAAGMSVRIAPAGRAVLRVGPDTIALSGGSEADLAKLDSSGTQLVLHQGRIGVRLSKLDPAYGIEVDIPKGGVWLLTPGEYDIAAGDEHVPARVAVLDGRARIVGKGLDAAVAAGSAAVLSGNDPVEQRSEAASADDFTLWWRAASGPADPPALRHLSAEMTGYEALDGNGSWETDPVYGDVWFPNATPADWAPYRNGHWRWVAPWGWTWIDDMPWAFAPSHYGRWAKIEETDALDPSSPGAARWGWVPGKRVADPVYAPALVAFLGTAGVGLSYPDAAGPAIAWFPLAPGEAYWPGYTTDLAAIRRLNRPAVADVATIGPAADGLPPADIVKGAYRNRVSARAVPRLIFTSGRPVRPALLTLPDRRLENAPLLAGSPQIGPPAPHPVQAAQAAVAHRAAVAVAAVKPRHATPAVLARKVERHGRPPVAHAKALVRRRFARGSIRVRARSHWANLRRRRAHVIAVASHGRLRLRLATARHAAIR